MSLPPIAKLSSLSLRPSLQDPCIVVWSVPPLASLGRNVELVIYENVEHILDAIVEVVQVLVDLRKILTVCTHEAEFPLQLDIFSGGHDLLELVKAFNHHSTITHTSYNQLHHDVNIIWKNERFKLLAV